MSIETEIEAILLEVDNDFSPPLSTRLVIKEYAKKISEKAELFSISECGKLLAFIAIYCNDFHTRTAFMTILAVAPSHRKKGLASNLVEKSIAYLRKIEFKALRLEVYKTNARAISLYEQFNFQKIGETDISVIMELMINKDYAQVTSNQIPEV